MKKNSIDDLGFLWYQFELNYQMKFSVKLDIVDQLLSHCFEPVVFIFRLEPKSRGHNDSDRD